MFTGIIEQAGKIESLERDANGGRLSISLGVAPEITADMNLGDSIAVNGCCLTVVEFDSTHFSADLSLETLRRTSFGEKKAGDFVNLERPLAAGARLGGHFVQGHVDGTATIAELTQQGDNWRLSVRLPEELHGYVAEKGSVAIDGISLTVARWQNGVASIAVIPYTYAHTNVQSMRVGDAVNIECDIMAKYIEGLLAARSGKETPRSRLTVERLVEQGF